jgi:hypothetical protein
MAALSLSVAAAFFPRSFAAASRVYEFALLSFSHIMKKNETKRERH